MRFRFLHALAATVPAVEEALVDPQALALLPRLARPAPLVVCGQLVRQRTPPGEIERVARFEVAGLHATCGPDIGPDGVSFTAWTLWRKTEQVGVFDIQFSASGWPLTGMTCQGQIRHLPEGENTSRLVEGELRAPVPLAGTPCGHALGKLLGIHFGAEAAALENIAARHLALHPRRPPTRMAPGGSAGMGVAV